MTCVLVVEDEPLVCAAHADYVRRVPGFELVGTAGTVRAAVHDVVALEVDLVLLDLNLPDGHGQGYRDYRSALGDADAATQSGVDALLRDLHRPPEATAPKGLTREVLDQVILALRETTSADGLSASEVATSVGASRVTARRYLEHLVSSGSAVRGQRMGGTGRPEVTFRWRNR